LRWLALAFVVVTSTIGACTIVLVGYGLVQTSMPRMRLEKASPSAVWLARLYRLPEGDDPPYGNAVGIVAARRPWVWGWGDMVFRFSGCVGEISITWESDQHLWVDCNGLGADPHPAWTNIRSQLDELGPIRIGYRIVRPD
jgi:hypothetical protein